MVRGRKCKQFVPPQTNYAPGLYLLRNHAERPGAFTGIGTELEIGNPDFTKEAGYAAALFHLSEAAHHARPRNRRTTG